jgi:hypothetical protein
MRVILYCEARRLRRSTATPATPATSTRGGVLAVAVCPYDAVDRFPVADRFGTLAALAQDRQSLSNSARS